MRKNRSRKGASMITLITCIAFFIVLPLSLLGFEIGRYFLLLTQVQNVAAACALSGTGAIATIPSTAPSGSALEGLYNGCAQEAVYCLQLNSLLGTQMAPNVSAIANNTLPPYAAPPTPPVGKGSISTSFVNLDGSHHTDLKQPGAVRMAVTISFTTKPIFSTPGMILSLIPQITATASSTGGLPQLDVFMCFDLSGSMDDQTGVCMVNRYWDPVANHIEYSFAANRGPGATPTTIWNQCPNLAATAAGIVGTQLNATPPQNLAKRDNTAMYFDQQKRCSLTATSEVGQPPGGVIFSAGVATAQTLTYSGVPAQTPLSGSVVNPLWINPYGSSFPSFTDMVVMPSAAAKVTDPYVVPSNWQNDAVIRVEQSRGNLTSTTTWNAANGGASFAANNPYKAVLTPKISGACTPQAYWAFAAMNSTPSYQALQAAQTFISTMNLSTDARFGLSTFTDIASSSANNKYPASAGSPNMYLISNQSGATYPDYTQGGSPNNKQFPLPFVSISEGTPGSYNKIYAAMAPPTSSFDPSSASNTVCTPMYQTDIYDAFYNGIQDVQSNGRATARKAIVLFTDGIPTPSIPNNDNASIIGLASTYCQPNNIPVYTIGLAQGANAALQTAEDALLQGVSNAGGNGGTYFPTQSADQLNSAFQSIARKLVLLRAAN